MRKTLILPKGNVYDNKLHAHPCSTYNECLHTHTHTHINIIIIFIIIMFFFKLGVKTETEYYS